MVHLKDVRYGNIIMNAHSGRIFRVQLVDMPFIEGGADDYRGVPILIDDLQQLGFIHVENTDNWVLVLGPFCRILVDGKTRTVKLSIGYNLETLAQEITLSHIKNLHQLQNLFYALTGADLTGPF